MIPQPTHIDKKFDEEYWGKKREVKITELPKKLGEMS